MLHLAMPLYIVLPAYKVPKEIAPVHKIHLITEEESKVLCGRGNRTLSLAISPLVIYPGVACRMHSREEHIIPVLVFNIMTDQVVMSFSLVGRGTIDGGTLFMFPHQVVALLLIVGLTAVRRAIEEGDIPILFPAQITL